MRDARLTKLGTLVIVATSALVACGGGGDGDVNSTSGTAAAPITDAQCQSLANLSLPNTTVKAAQAIPAGSYQPPGSATTYTNLPRFCRVTATVTPVAGSSIGIEVWLPTSTWNGKYQQVGSHGFAGTFFWGEMVAPLRRGYATAATDNGHTAPANGFDMSWAIGHPEAVTDFASRAVHELAVSAKRIIAAQYGRPQKYAYFHGCSDGGREGMKSVQAYPDEFNGVIAGSAFTYWSGSSTQLLSATTNLVATGIQGTSGAALLTLAQKATYAACDSKDGVTDGIINNPTRCNWDPATVVCTPGQDPATCMTAAQANAIKANEATVLDPVSGKFISSNWAVGSEFEQIRRGWNNGINTFGIANYKLGLNDASFDGTRFDIATQWPTVAQTLASIDAIDPNLSAARQAGAKVIQWHGWSDSSITPGGIVRYYDNVVQQTGAGDLAKVQDFYRLFMLPGVGHCGTGVGPDNIGAENQTATADDAQHDVVTALEDWVEKGIPPAQLIASKVAVSGTTSSVTMQRPICVYPSEAIYNGSGDVNSASSFHCGPAPAP